MSILQYRGTIVVIGLSEDFMTQNGFFGPQILGTDRSLRYSECVVHYHGNQSSAHPVLLLFGKPCAWLEIMGKEMLNELLALCDVILSAWSLLTRGCASNKPEILQASSYPVLFYSYLYTHCLLLGVTYPCPSLPNA